ncbi:hypothetical protein F3Y22_tig00110194pilonHSYRG00044 [Hibiscus syriacus]|uniref:CRC domain-containing protein n=1 Tax=Hibiscus syriacus TaxID=106335 RepID=A0A6A3BCR3_HIBSY|nr:hypothetical protein F3Y22_tig00110194pilonHSYRG00044 [Hibiscus syriacus]
MESPSTDENAIDASAEKKSPFSKFLNDLSPIKLSRARVPLYARRLGESSFQNIPLVFSSPHLDRPTSFLQRYCGSNSNAIKPSNLTGAYQGDPKEAAVTTGGAYQGDPKEVVTTGGAYQGDPKEVVTTGGAYQGDPKGEIQGDQRLNNIVEFPYENTWNVDSYEFKEHQAMSTQVLPTTTVDDHAPQNMETQWDSHNVPCFNQPGIPCQQFADSQDNTERRSYCECFAAGIYCEDCCACESCFNKPDYEEIVLENRHKVQLRNPLAFAPPIVKAQNDSLNNTGDENSNTPSARHKRGCKCKRSKCLKNYCECYRAKVGCSDGCHCENCDNSFGKKSESKVHREERCKNQSHEMSNTADVMYDSIKVETANQFLPTWETLTDVNQLVVSTHPQSRVVPSFTSHDMRDCQNVSQAESERGTNLHWWSSALSSKQPSPSKLHSFDDIGEMMEDGLPNFLIENSDPANTVKSGSPNQKRISPPKFQSNEFGLNIPPHMPTARKLVLNMESLSRFPTPTTWFNNEDLMNQAENYHQGNNHDK